MLLAFMVIGDSGNIGRQALAQRAGLGDGAVRTVLKKLRDEGYADADASGCHLTRPGERIYKLLRNKITHAVVLGGSQLTMGRVQVSLAVRIGGGAVGSGIEQRDSAIRIGAAGATTYVIKSGRFAIPGGSTDCERDFPSRAWAKLRSALNPGEGDAVILCGSDSETTARLGALSAALMLL